MVLWEIAVGTAYFLGLRRSYRLALKTQRRIISPNHPRIRQFLHRRTHQIFDVALRVHKNIQQRDMELGRNLGNRILKWLDRMKPSAQVILPKPTTIQTEATIDKAKRLLESTQLKPITNITPTPQNSEVDRHLFSSLKNLQPKIPLMMIKPPRPTGSTTQLRNYSSAREFSLVKPIYTRSGFDGGVIRKDILQWIAQR